MTNYGPREENTRPHRRAVGTNLSWTYSFDPAKLKPPFRVVNWQVSFRKARYPRLGENGMQVSALFALTNLVLYPIALKPQ